MSFLFNIGCYFRFGKKSNVMRAIIIIIALAVLWQLVIFIFKLPPYILPTPKKVLLQLYNYRHVIFINALPTIYEATAGFILGSLIGIFAAVFVSYFQPARHWFLPILLISQALPTFVVAPLFVIWFGYGEISKIVTCILMLFFPVTSAFYDGINKTDPGFLDLAKTMNASKWQTLWQIKIPAALPALASGLRVAATFAPIGAIVGEWVGASHGLGFLMLNANARMQIDLMFAVLLIVIILTLLFYFSIDRILRKFIYW